MHESERSHDTTSPAHSSQQVGTPLVRYGFTSDSTLGERISGQKAGPVAILVCHGMGQQVRYETISSVAEAIRREATTQNGEQNVEPVGVHVSYEKASWRALNWIGQTRIAKNTPCMFTKRIGRL